MKTNNNFKHISSLNIINYSGFIPKLRGINITKKHCYTVMKDIAVTGDAPKDIIRCYEYGKALKKKHKKWPIYIAKLGHKYYPMESITEQLITDIGFIYGFNLASSKISLIGGQIRFLSLYFLRNECEELFHGADMYAGFLNNDKNFIDEIEKKGMTQDFFTIEFTKNVIEFFFSAGEKDKIFRDFMRMLFFDGLVGNNDRHMYNWGIVRDIFGKKQANFSPIYDTARGLLWNTKEEKISKIIDNNQNTMFIKKYCNNSKPKIGIEGQKMINHFELIKHYKKYFKKDKFIVNLLLNETIYDVVSMIKTKYSGLLSEKRRRMIIEILLFRFDKIKEIIGINNIKSC